MKHLNTLIFLCISVLNTNAQGLNFDSSLVLHLPIDHSVQEVVDNYYIKSNGYSFEKDRNGSDSCAIRFDGGNEYIEIMNFSSNLPLEEITVSFWLKADRVRSQNVLMLMPNDESNRVAISAYYSHNGVPSHFWDFGSISTERLELPNISFDGKWHFITCTSSVDADEMKMYLDGTVIATLDHASKLDFVNKALRFGGGKDLNFDGCVDDLRIYDQALNQNQIKTLMQVESCSNTNLPPSGANYDKHAPIEVSVYPNPANSYINIDLPTVDLNGYTLRVYNEQGELIYKIHTEEKQIKIQLDGNLKEGIYLINVLGSDHKTRFVKKVMVIQP